VPGWQPWLEPAPRPPLSLLQFYLAQFVIFLMCPCAGCSRLQGLFKALVGYLRQFSNRRGIYAQRCVHLMLDALLMRIRNKGSYAINTAPRKITVQVVPSFPPALPWHPSVLP